MCHKSVRHDIVIRCCSFHNYRRDFRLWRHGVEPDHSQQQPGLTEDAIAPNHSQQQPGLTEDAIAPNHSQQQPGCTEDAIAPNHSQQQPGFTEDAIETDQIYSLVYDADRHGRFFFLSFMIYTIMFSSTTKSA